MHERGAGSAQVVRRPFASGQHQGVVVAPVLQFLALLELKLPIADLLRDGLSIQRILLISTGKAPRTGLGALMQCLELTRRLADVDLEPVTKP